MLEEPFVPTGFAVPGGLTTEEFRLQSRSGRSTTPAITLPGRSSIEHILATPDSTVDGPYENDARRQSPRSSSSTPGTLRNRVGFTCTVLAPARREVDRLMSTSTHLTTGAQSTRVKSWVPSRPGESRPATLACRQRVARLRMALPSSRL